MKRILTIGVVFTFFGLACAPSLNAYIPEIKEQVDIPTLNRCLQSDIVKMGFCSVNNTYLGGFFLYILFLILEKLYELLYNLTDGFQRFTPFEYALYWIICIIAVFLMYDDWNLFL